jgi:hypothetical protein
MAQEDSPFGCLAIVGIFLFGGLLSFIIFAYLMGYDLSNWGPG